MSARIHGLTIASLIPAPDLFLARDSEGKTTAQRSFTCLKSSVQTATIQSKIKKGTPITSLCSDIPPEFSSLTVESSASRDAPGGMTAIDITFAGYVEEGEFGLDREITFSLRGVTQTRPIWQHPKFIDAFDGFDQLKSALVKVCLGEAYAEDATLESNNWRVYQIPTDEPLFTAWTGDEEMDKWWVSITVDGDREYDAPTYEWTRATSNAGGLSSSDIEYLGKKDDPPGNPPEPAGQEGYWKLSDLSDERTSGQSSNTLTWRFIEGKPKHYETES
jgi:hypothetical protein